MKNRNADRPWKTFGVQKDKATAQIKSGLKDKKYANKLKFGFAYWGRIRYIKEDNDFMIPFSACRIGQGHNAAPCKSRITRVPLFYFSLNVMPGKRKLLAIGKSESFCGNLLE